ncbi:uncharacterized protein LOC142560104 [Dermacentor variabilis]|uniref:uncharacterized protein LOC142560104 n=1 Tax=Dermacentor variabilis TaxID=34621 RepID=UPI003F5C7233
MTLQAFARASPCRLGLASAREEACSHRSRLRQPYGACDCSGIPELPSVSVSGATKRPSSQAIKGLTPVGRLGNGDSCAMPCESGRMLSGLGCGRRGCKFG